MSRLGVLYALKEDELNKLRSLPHDERYDYMLEEIEETLLETPRGCELDNYTKEFSIDKRTRIFIT